MTDKNRSKFDIKPDKAVRERVLIDLDGVVRDFVTSLVNVYQREHPDHIVKPVISRKLEDFFPLGENIYKFLEDGFIREVMEEAPAYPGALDALHKWQNDFDIVIVTAQPAAIKASTYIWIGKNNLATSEVHITYNKADIDGIALLDDFPENLQEFSDTGRLAVCLDQPWNQQYEGIRVKTVDEFFRYVKAAIEKTR
jgi:5'(3')-deoxyribonucleotidase